VPRARWTLALLIATVLWLARLTPSGAHRLLGRLGIVYRRGQEHLHSPDPEYGAKMAAVRRARSEAGRSGGRVVVVYLDEVTYYRRPSVGRCYAPAGGPGPYAEQGLRANTKRRVIGALDARSGRLTYWQGAHAGVAQLVRFYARLRAEYPDAEAIYVAQDNWPVHFHPTVLGAVAGTPIRLLRLPTYAPWTNPVEKVWRKLRQEILHQHDYGDDWAGLTGAVSDWLARARDAPDGLRRYTGLRPRRAPKHSRR
jgi:transposase